MVTPQEYNKLREEELILKAAKSSGANKAEILHGSLFVTFTPGFVDVLSQELKGVLEKLLDNTQLRCIILTKANTLTTLYNRRRTL